MIARRLYSIGGAKRTQQSAAICRAIPRSFVDALSMHGTDESIDIAKAQQQHENYVQVLQQHVATVTCLPALEDYPDCAFVEDTVVAIGTTCCLTRLGAHSRQGEGDAIQEVLERLGIGNLINMNEMRNDAICDGGDVLFTGRHLFVGLSTRTNMAGVEVLKEAFRDLEIPIIAVPPIVAPGSQHVLHLKSAVTHLDESTILAPEGSLGDVVLNSMQSIRLGYNAIRLPNVLACNAVVANGHILAQHTACAVSTRRLHEVAARKNMGLTFVDTSELAKKDGALTCCSVLFN